MLSLIREIKRQFSHSSVASSSSALFAVSTNSEKSVKSQILEALKDRQKRLIFILSPKGSGTTTLIHSFMKENRQFFYRYRSFIRIESFDFAFLYLTGFKMRFFFFSLFTLVAYFLFPFVPGPAVMPILLIVAFFFLKSFGHMVYIMHEILDNLVFWKSKVYILEDLSKAPLDPNQKWEFLSSLWKNKRSYIITLGYSLQNPQERMGLIENAVKLGGIIIQSSIDEIASEEFIKKLEPDFPFAFSQQSHKAYGWLSLFTFGDLKTIYEQVVLQQRGEGEIEKNDKINLYVELTLSLLLAKLNLSNQEFIFDKEKKIVRMPPLDKLRPDQIHFLQSFSQSLSLYHS